MDYKKELYAIVDKLLTVRLFDIQSFTFNFKRMVDKIWHFHNTIGRNAPDSNTLSYVKFDLPKGFRITEGQVGYFFIENSYPKEIFNSHWCLVLKDFGNTMLVIPMTSIKKDKKPVDKTKEMIIKIKNFEEEGCSKLKIHQIMSADKMRIDTNKKVYDLQTDYSFVKRRIFEIIGFELTFSKISI